MQRTTQGNDLDHTIVVNPTMVPVRPNHVNKKPCFNTNERSNIKGESHPLILNSTMKLVAWMVSGGLSLTGAYQERLPNSLHVTEGKGQDTITKQPGENGVVKEKCVPLNVLTY